MKSYADQGANFAELCEIDENLVRAELSDAQRARAHARRKELMEGLGLVQGVGRPAKSRQNAEIKSYAEQAAECLGVHADTVRRDLARGRDIDPAVLADADDLNGAQLDDVRRAPRELQAARVAEIRATARRLSGRTIARVQRAPAWTPAVSSPSQPAAGPPRPLGGFSRDPSATVNRVGSHAQIFFRSAGNSAAVEACTGCPRLAAKTNAPRKPQKTEIIEISAQRSVPRRAIRRERRSRAFSAHLFSFGKSSAWDRGGERVANG